MSTHLCAHSDCNFMVMLTPSGWAHVDTHGIPTDHEAWPSQYFDATEDAAHDWTGTPNLSTQAEAFATLDDEGYADLMNGRVSLNDPDAMLEAAAARVRAEADARLAAISVARAGEPIQPAESGFTYTRMRPDPEVATEASYWEGWADAESHIARLLGWNIEEAPGD